jgi:hypothetical protein
MDKLLVRVCNKVRIVMYLRVTPSSPLIQLLSTRGSLGLYSGRVLMHQDRLGIHYRPVFSATALQFNWIVDTKVIIKHTLTMSRCVCLCGSTHKIKKNTSMTYDLQRALSIYRQASVQVQQLLCSVPFPAQTQLNLLPLDDSAQTQLRLVARGTPHPTLRRAAVGNWRFSRRTGVRYGGRDVPFPSRTCQIKRVPGCALRPVWHQSKVIIKHTLTMSWCVYLCESTH